MKQQRPIQPLAPVLQHRPQEITRPQWPAPAACWSGDGELSLNTCASDN